MSSDHAIAAVAKRVLVADDHPLYRDALCAVLPQACPGSAVVEARSAAEVLELVTSDADFDLILLDLNLPGASGVSCLRSLRAEAPLTPVVVVSAVDDPGIMSEVVMAGATAYVPKSAPRQVLVDAIRAIMAGGTYLPAAAVAALRETQSTPPSAAPPAFEALTQRQRRVLGLLAEGHSNKQIARTLGISEVTVKAHVSSILRKFGFTNRTQAAIEAGKRRGSL